jgi:tellurite methyltransferase
VSDAAPEPESARAKWNRRYSTQPARPLPDVPAEWLLENRSVVVASRGRRALDVACGAGRNALFLAGLGFEVDAVDVSDVAIDRLHAVARERSLPIRAHRLDLEREPLPFSGYAVIVQIDYLQRDLFGPLERALAPGGSLVVETVTRAHVERLGHRFDRRFVLEPGELLRAFPELQVHRYEEGVADRSGRPRAVASLLAQRPEGP